MHRARMGVLIAFGTAATGVAIACGGGDGSSPVQGSEGGACYANQTCNAGLTCLSNFCVAVPGDGSADMTIEDATLPDGSASDVGGGDATRDADASVGTDAGCPVNTPTRCNGVCVDVQTDRQSCGACGHDCLGGACSVGVCQPIVVAQAQNAPGPITLDANNIYWINVGAGTAMKMPIGGGSTFQLTAGVGSGVTSIAVDATSVYWSDIGGGSINKVPIATGSITPLATGSYQPKGLAVANGMVYFTDFGNQAGGVYAVPTGGGSVVTLSVAGGGPDPIAADATNVYWSPQIGCTNQSPIDQMHTNGTNVVVVAPGQDCPRYMAIDSAFVYWTASAGGNVRRAPIGGGTVTTIASGQPNSFQIVVDATYAYFADGAGNIKKVLKSGGTPTTLVSAQNPGGIAVDATFVYWTHSASMSVKKVVK